MRRGNRACIQDCHSWSLTILFVRVDFNVGWLERYALQAFDASNIDLLELLFKFMRVDK